MDVENASNSSIDTLSPDSASGAREAGAGAYSAGPAKVAGAKRAKSSLRLKYEAETQVIERKLGDLESIREKLGLSQRKIAQLLLVDPSAWTRWTKGQDQAPPHIYRMLQWYLALEDKYPALDVNFWLSNVAQVNNKSAKSFEALSDLARTSEQRENSLRKLIRWFAFTSILVGFLIGFLAAQLLR